MKAYHKRQLNTFDLCLYFMQRRRSLKMSQREISARYGIPRGKYAHWELGNNPTLKDVPVVCKILGWTPDQLFGWSPRPELSALPVDRYRVATGGRAYECRCKTRINLPSMDKQMCVDCLAYYDIKSGERVEIKHQR